MKRLSYIIIFLVGAVGLLEWLSRGYLATWEPRLRTYIEASASRATQKSVHIDSIIISPFRTIRLLNVRLEDPAQPEPPLFSANEIDLSLNPVGLPQAILKRQGYLAIGSVLIHEPHIRIPKDGIKSPSAASTKKPLALPPWFTLAWENGNLQWEDPNAPHGQWTLYQSHGAYRILGPQSSLTVDAGIEQAQRIRLEGSVLGRRWNAKLTLTEGHNQDILELLESLLKHPLLPENTRWRGTIDGDVMASGREWPPRAAEWLKLLDKVSLRVHDAPLVSTTTAQSLGLTGTFTYKNRKLSCPQLEFDAPWGHAKGSFDLALNASTGAPLSAHALVTTGHVGIFRFQNADVKFTKSQNTWTISNSSLQLLGGRLLPKGTWGPSGLDISLTAESLALSEFFHQLTPPPLTGALNASCTIKGTLDAWQLAGAWWSNEAVWGTMPLGNPKGDFTAAAQQFQAQGKSDQTKFRIALAASRSPKQVEVDQFDVMLPDNASLSASARYDLTRQKLLATWNASRANLATDLPFLKFKRLGFNGLIKGQGQITGPLDALVHKMTLQSDALQYKNLNFGESTATLSIQGKTIEIPTFRTATGIEGQFSNDHGSVTLHNATIGSWTVDRGSAHFKLLPNLFELTDLSLDTKRMRLTGKGTTAWEPLSQPSATRVNVKVQGTMQSTGITAPSWSIPISVNGPLEFRPDGRTGTLRVEAEMLGGRLQGDYVLGGSSDRPENSFVGKLGHGKWESFPFSADIRESWSGNEMKPLVVKGHFDTGGDFEFTGQLQSDAQANGSLKLLGFNLKPLSDSLHFPKKIEGIVQATLTVSGPWDALRWSGHIAGGPVIYAPESPRPYRVEEVSLEMTLDPQPTSPKSYRLSITEGLVKTAEELVRFHPKSYIDFAGTQPAKLAIGADLRNLHLGLFTLFGGLVLDGQWQIKPEGFAIQARTQTRSLFINDYELNEGTVQVDYYNGILRFTAAPDNPALISGTIDFHKAPHLKLTDVFITGKYGQGLRLNGDIGPTLWDFTMDGKGLDLSTLGELGGFPYSLNGEADIQISGRGDMQRPHLEGKVEMERGAVMGLAYRTGRAAFVWQDDRITFTKLLLTDPGRYTLEGSGVFPLRKKPGEEGENSTVRAIRRRVSARSASGPPIDFSVRLKDSNLSLLQSFSSEVTSAKGPVEGLLQIKGSLEDPSLHGYMKISNGDIEGAHYFRRLRSGTLALDFEGDTITIKDLRGKSGEGEFRATGKVKLADFVPSIYDVELSVVSNKGVEIQIPELAIPDSPLAKRFKFLTTESRGLLRGHVALRGPAENPTFSGDALISDGHFTFPPSQKRPPNPRITEWFRRIYWDVSLKFGDGAWFENELVQASVAGTLLLKGPSDRLVVDGGLDIREGRFSYLGLQFDIQQARYDIRAEKEGERIINRPYVRGVGEAKTQAVDTISGSVGGSRLSSNDTITLNIDYAPVDQIKPRLTSAANPTLSQEKLFARVTQTDTENLTLQERTYLYQKQLISVIDSSLTTPLAQNVLKKVGIADRLRAQHLFDANAVTGGDLNTTSQQQSSAASLLANTKYTIEKDLSTRLSLGYGVRFIPSAQVDPALEEKKLDLVSDVQLNYRWFSNVYLRGSFDLPNSNPSILPERRVTIEPRWRFGWWGNTNKEKKK